MELWIVGPVCRSLPAPAAGARLKCFGIVSEERKRELLLAADVALNPASGGGGSSLKIGDYLSHGLPVVTTATGARGFALVDGVEAAIAPLDRFPAALGRLAADPAARDAMARSGRKFAAAHLGWPQLGEAYAALVAGPPPAAPLRILVATYRATEPPLGGAEDYLAKLLQALGAAGDTIIDLYAPSIDWIANLSRFIALAPPQPASAARLVAPFLRRIRLFPPDAPDEAAAEAACWRLFRQWQAEALALGRTLAPLLRAPLLLGGWNAAERDRGVVTRWSTGNAEIFIPAGFRRLVLRGFHRSDRLQLKIRRNGGKPASVRLDPAFEHALTLDPGRDNLIELAMTPRPAPDGVLIELGLALTGATLTAESGKTVALDLAEDFESFAGRQMPGQWIEWIAETARCRPPALDADFQALRGPHSTAMLAELTRIVGDYDVVLVQGVPFGLSVAVGAIAGAAGVPYVVLPHFHVEDRFYHWAAYYRLFAEAAGVLTFSGGLASDLMRQAGGRPVPIAGGGVDPAEFAYQAACLQAFRALHRSPRRYFLVLGRKSGSKRGALAIEAWRPVAAELGVELVFIGADEGAAIPDETGLFDYRLLARPLVIGALAGCIALVTMSESESFGTVLLEAWMSGRPVLANAGTLAFAELVADGEDGILVHDIAGLSAAMRRLATDPALAAELGSRGHAKAQRFTWNNLAATLRDALSQAAAR
jgi:glycosyltransferase involved in cell wall biosynthesis